MEAPRSRVLVALVRKHCLPGWPYKADGQITESEKQGVTREWLFADGFRGIRFK